MQDTKVVNNLMCGDRNKNNCLLCAQVNNITTRAINSQYHKEREGENLKIILLQRKH